MRYVPMLAHATRVVTRKVKNIISQNKIVTSCGWLGGGCGGAVSVDILVFLWHFCGLFVLLGGLNVLSESDFLASWGVLVAV